jgi:hypothetical protein
MPTPNQFSNADFNTNLLLNALNMDDKSAKVYDFSGGYNVIDLLATRNAPSRQIVGLDGVFQKPILGRSQIVAQVATTAVVGSNLQVNWTDPNYDLFRTTMSILDGTANMNIGRVVSHGPGFVVLEPGAGIAAWNPAIHFIAGSYAIEAWQSSANRLSDGVASQYEYPVYVKNQTAICRENVQLARRDMSQTWVKYKGDFWYSAQDMIMAQRYAREMEISALFSQFGTINSSLGGTVNYSMGLKASIKDPLRGGIYLGLSNAMTQQQFEDWIGQLADRQSAQHVELNLLMGRGAMNLIQQFSQKYIITAGINNTFGGATVKGIDIKTYSINGITCNFIMLPLFNDREKFPTQTTVPGLSNYTRMQYTIVALGGSLPAVEKCYFGNDEMIYYYTPGVIGSSLKGGSMFKTGNPFLAANDKDGVTFGMYSDIAYDFMSYRMGWLELVV